MRYKLLFPGIVISMLGCSNNVSELITGKQTDVSQSTSRQCHQQARDNVRQNWQKIGRDWIKHEEFRQYKICVNNTKNSS